LKHLISLKSKNVIGSLTLTVATAISGCASPEDEQNNQPAENPQETGNKILTIEEKAEGKYVIVDEAPTSGPNKAIITDINGTTRVLNEQQMQEFAQAEMNKVESGTSNLTAPPTQEQDDGLGMGELLLAGAAGALLGGLAANALSNNSNYQANQQRYNQSSSFQSRMGGTGGGRTTSSTTTSKQNFFNKPSSATSSPSTSKPNLGKSSGSSSGGFFGG
jgi:hypothetical protein